MPDAFDAPAPTARDEQEFDRYGRYVLPDPYTGKKASYTRATTYAKSISDTYALGQWMLRMAVKGVATRPDLYALAASTPIDDKDALNRIAEDAKEAAAAKAGANLGTALHSFTEQLDRGQSPVVPEPWARDVAAYKVMLSTHGIRIDPALIERKVVVPDIAIAGTLDRIIHITGRQAIGDLKTGQSLDFGWLEIAVQLAIYSRATHIWDPVTRTFAPMPAVDQDTAYVFHLPVGKATATLYEVDIAAGWEATRLCGQVRDWRKRKDLARAIPAPSSTAVTSTAPASKAPVKAAAKKATAAKRGSAATGSGSLGLHALINKAATVAELEALWAEADAVGAWRDAHTEAARKRKDFLLSTEQGTK